MSDQQYGNQLIKRYRTEYQAALDGIENNVSELIKAGKEMRAIMSLNDYLAKIIDIHEQLGVYYSAILKYKAVLGKFGSIRIQQWGQELAPTMKTLEDMSIDNDAKEACVYNAMHAQGYHHNHWFIKERLLNEVDYMLDVLEILIEPDFMPILDSVDSEGQSDRRISSEVKLGVWRRDGGKCVMCGSREKLEYDHIIPVSKGGSNTERNVQLLCEKCNRQKAAQIQ